MTTRPVESELRAAADPGTDSGRSADVELVSTIVDSPVGQLTVVASPVGVRAVMWPRDESRVPQTAGATRLSGSDAAVHPILGPACEQLGQYFAGERTDFDVPLDPAGTSFQRAAWEALRAIPFGETVSYGEQAERLGDKSKARAVGAANGKNPISIIVPCHRVVGSDGSLTGFAGGVDAKRYLLDHEQRVAGHTLL